MASSSFQDSCVKMLLPIVFVLLICTCVVSSDFGGIPLRYAIPRDCSEVQGGCGQQSWDDGVYWIRPDGYLEPFQVFCDQSVAGGGWTVIHRRLDGSINFNRRWGEYKRGFGFLGSSFWLGNEKLAFLTNQKQYEVRIEITMANGSSFYTNYSRFRISDETSNYKLATIGRFDSHGDSVIRFAYPRDCSEVREGVASEGIHWVKPDGNIDPFQVYCNQSIDGGGWTVFQRRMGGPGVDFYRGWNDYKNGFGSLLTEFWLGNEKLALLTNQRDYQLRIDIVNKRHSSYFAKYTSFRIGDERLHYKLVDIGVFEGTTVSDAMEWHRNRYFSTYDSDHDNWNGVNCAEMHRGAWWYGYDAYGDRKCEGMNYYCKFWRDTSGVCGICGHSNLNGNLSSVRGGESPYWTHLAGSVNQCGMRYIDMKIRPVS